MAEESPDRPPLTLLYVPGDRPDRMRKALNGDADVVLLDLEDAVAAGAKARARAAVAELLAAPMAKPVQVRINHLDGPWGGEDLAAVAGLPGLGGLRLPKIDDPAMVRVIAERAPGTPLHPLLETALGVERAFAVATAHPRVASVALGEADLRGELGVSDDAGLSWARSRLVIAARAAGLPAPVQSVYTNIRDTDGLAESCRDGRAMGFLGRAAIHPAQVPVIADAYRPSAGEVAAARQVTEAAAAAEDDGSGAVALPDGRFVDIAVVRAAQQTIVLSGGFGVRDAQTEQPGDPHRG